MAALFRVARKVAPTIIFIDEVAASLPSTTRRRLYDCSVLAAACSVGAVSAPVNRWTRVWASRRTATLNCFTLAAACSAAAVNSTRTCVQVDALLGRRKDGDHEATTNLKTEFMQHWDGLLPVDATHHILVLGATNRPAELDAAVMRRFSLQLEVRRRRRRCGASIITNQALCAWRSEAVRASRCYMACNRTELWRLPWV